MIRICRWPRQLERVCNTCTASLPLAAFGACVHTSDGVRGACLSCERRQRVPRPYTSRSPRQEEAHQRRNTAWRTRHPGVRARLAREWRAANPKATAAHNAVARALRSGTLVKPETCQRCPRKGRLEGHHEDYDKPLEVEWLCRRCHTKADVMELGVAV